MLIQGSHIRERSELGYLLNDRGMRGEAVEVGTHRGDFANAFLKKWWGRKLWCVDHYPANYDPADPAALGDRSEDYEAARNLLKTYGDRVQFILEPSQEATACFEDETLDLVYVDAHHRTEPVYEDLKAWWPKVKPAGLLAGHDIVCVEWDRFIQPAVFRFAEEVGADVWLAPEPPYWPWSYYLVKR